VNRQRCFPSSNSRLLLLLLRIPPMSLLVRIQIPASRQSETHDWFTDKPQAPWTEKAAIVDIPMTLPSVSRDTQFYKKTLTLVTQAKSLRINPQQKRWGWLSPVRPLAAQNVRAAAEQQQQEEERERHKTLLRRTPRVWCAAVYATLLRYRC
jgi:hypothetical protein